MAPHFKALLLAAGNGTRLRPLTDVLPKCLMPIRGRPLLGLWLEMLLDAGVTDISVNLHHKAELVREYVQRSPFARFVNLLHEKELLGTGGTLLRHKKWLAGGDFLVAHADNLTIFDPARFLAAYRMRPSDSVLGMMTFVTDSPKQCGIIEVNENDIVTGFHEKVADPPSNLANAGVYIADDALFSFLERVGRPTIDFSTQVVSQLMGRIFVFHNDCYHRDIGTLASLLQAQLEYPLVCASRSRPSADSDPWYGLMQADGRRLERDFLRVVRESFSSHHDILAPVAGD